MTTERQDAELLAELTRPRGCPACGAVFADSTAYALHRDERWPGGCLPEGAMGQLVQRDGVWCTR